MDTKAHDLSGNDVNDGFGDRRDTGRAKRHHEPKQLVKKTHESSIFLNINPQIQVKIVHQGTMETPKHLSKKVDSINLEIMHVERNNRSVTEKLQRITFTIFRSCRSTSAKPAVR